MSFDKVAAEVILSRPRFLNSGWYDTRSWWTDWAQSSLKVLVEAGADLEQSARALGRSPKSIANRARDCGMALPASWRAAIAPKKKPRILSVAPVALSYPYIIKARGDHADLLAVNDLVPKTIPDFLRADICQDIMLALLEGTTSLEELRREGVAAFSNSARRANAECGGYAVSLDAPMRDGRSWHDVLESTTP